MILVILGVVVFGKLLTSVQLTYLDCDKSMAASWNLTDSINCEKKKSNKNLKNSPLEGLNQ